MCHRKNTPAILQTYYYIIVQAQITWSGTRLVDTRSKQLLMHVLLYSSCKHINSMPESSVVFQVLQIDKDLRVSGYPNLMTMHSFVKNYEMINSSNLGVGGSIQCLNKKKIKELFHRFYESLSYAQLANNPKARLYLSSQRKLTYETYLETVKDRKIRVQYTKLRLSDHILEIESGRHKKIERQQRFCSSCNSYNIGYQNCTSYLNVVNST